MRRLSWLFVTRTCKRVRFLTLRLISFRGDIRILLSGYPFLELWIIKCHWEILSCFYLSETKAPYAAGIWNDKRQTRKTERQWDNVIGKHETMIYQSMSNRSFYWRFINCTPCVITENSVYPEMGHVQRKRVLEHAQIHSCTCAKYHTGICSLLIYFIVSNDSVSGQLRPWSDCADLGLRCQHMPEGTF